MALKLKQAEGLCLEWFSVYSLLFLLSHTSTHTGPFRAADRAAGYGLEMNEKSG